MRILRANATYGKLNQAQLALHPGLNVICAPNEGGKSTWSRFLLAMFYGLNTRQRGELADKNRFQPWNGSPMQGTLELAVGEDVLTLSRRTQRADAPLGVFSCTYAGTDTPVGGLDAARCGETLLGVPQSVYQRCAFISAGSLAIDADADLERRINALISSGEEKISFSQAENRLKKQLHQRKYNRSGTIPLLESEISALEDAKSEADALAGQEALLQQQFVRAQEEQSSRLTARQQELQQKIQEKQRLLAALPERSALQNINEQSGAVRSMAEQVQQARDEAARQEEAIQESLRKLAENPLHPMTKAELEAQLEIKPQTPPQIAQLLISLAVGLCGGGFLWYTLGLSHTLPLCIACVVTGLAAGNFIRLLIARIRLQNDRRRELERQEELRALAEDYLPMLEKLDGQRELLQRQHQTAADSEGRLRAALAELLAQVRKWDAGVQSAADIRSFAEQADRQRESLTEEIRRAQAELTQMQNPGAGETVLRLRQQIAQVQGRRAALTGMDDPTEQIRRKEAQLRQQQEEYDALAMALEALRNANTTLQNRFSPELGRRAAEIFADMTGSDWSRIQLDREFHLSAEAGDDPARRSVQLLSSGTADQLYLATRLAVCEMVLPKEQNAPLILDDALLTFDDERLHRTLDYLARLGEERQILLFTCQKREGSYLQGRPDAHIITI